MINKIKRIIFFITKKNYHFVLVLLLTGAVQTFAQGLKLTSFSPASGPVGTQVTINGSGFSADTANNTVYFGATRATINKAKASQLLVTVPLGATYKPVTVINKSTRLIGRSNQSFSPSFAQTGTEVGKPVRLPHNIPASGVSIGDIDGDGKTDLLVTNPVQGTLMIYRNKSKTGIIDTGSFAEPVSYPVGSQSGFVSVDDLDGDGDIDIVLMNVGYADKLDGNNSLTIFINASKSGKIKLAAMAVTDSTAKVPATYNFALKPGDKLARVSDFDGDGRPDLAVLNAAGFISIYHSTSVTGTSLKKMFSQPIVFPVGLNPIAFNIGDIDCDGKPDILTASRDSSSITFLRNTTITGAINAYSFRRKDIQLGYQPVTVTLADVDRDGKLDIAISRADNKMVLIHNTSTTGRFSVTGLTISNLKVLSNYDDDIVMQDANGDGKPDLLSLTADLRSVNLYTNKSAPGQTTREYFNNEVKSRLATIPDCIADLDGDGRPEMIIGNGFGIDIYRGQSSSDGQQPALLQTSPLPAPGNTLTQDYVNIYPNPASAYTNVQYNLPLRSDVTISVSDNLGKILKSFKTGEQAAGDCVNAIGTSELKMGVYVVTVSGVGYNKVGKLIIK